MKREEIERLVRPAVGYLELGMPAEAAEELDALPPAAAKSRVALELQTDAASLTAAWERMRAAAEELANSWPDTPRHWISLAYATRRCRSIPAARAILEKAAGLHPGEAIIQFNLACYAAQTGDLAAARDRLARAKELDPQTQDLAENDPDLAPLRAEPNDETS